MQARRAELRDIEQKLADIQVVEQWQHLEVLYSKVLPWEQVKEQGNRNLSTLVLYVFKGGPESCRLHHASLESTMVSVAVFAILSCTCSTSAWARAEHIDSQSILQPRGLVCAAVL